MIIMNTMRRETIKNRLKMLRNRQGRVKNLQDLPNLDPETVTATHVKDFLHYLNKKDLQIQNVKPTKSVNDTQLLVVFVLAVIQNFYHVAFLCF